MSAFFWDKFTQFSSDRVCPHRSVTLRGAAGLFAAIFFPLLPLIRGETKFTADEIFPVSEKGFPLLSLTQIRLKTKNPALQQGFYKIN